MYIADLVGKDFDRWFRQVSKDFALKVVEKVKKEMSKNGWSFEKTIDASSDEFITFYIFFKKEGRVVRVEVTEEFSFYPDYIEVNQDES